MTDSKMRKPNETSVESLSEAARALTHQMLDRQLDAATIARRIAQTTREKIPAGTIARHAKAYAKKMQASQNARRETSKLLERIHTRGGQVSEMLRSALHETLALAKSTGPAEATTPLDWEAAERHRTELGLRKKHASIAERRQKLLEDRWNNERKKKAETHTAELDRKARAGKSLTTEEVNRIREFYDLPSLPGEPEHQPN